MSPLTDVLQEVYRGLLAFCDPGTEPLLDGRSAMWEQNGVQITVGLAASDNSLYPDIVHQGKKIRYREFLAGPHLANLTQLAEFIRRTSDRPRTYIDTDGKPL